MKIVQQIALTGDQLTEWVKDELDRWNLLQFPGYESQNRIAEIAQLVLGGTVKFVPHVGFVVEELDTNKNE